MGGIVVSLLWVSFKNQTKRNKTKKKNLIDEKSKNARVISPKYDYMHDMRLQKFGFHNYYLLQRTVLSHQYLP